MDELHGYYLDELSEGMTALYAKTVTETDIVLFAGISGDINPVHLNHEFANQSLFKGPVAHGMLTASFISTVIGTKLPGPGCIYLSQALRFLRPVRAGDTVRARATIRAINREKKQAIIDTVCTVDGKSVIEGEATVLVPVRA